MERFRRYTWIGGRITKDQMNELYRIRQVIGKPITLQVHEAVEAYIKARTGKEQQRTGGPR